MKETTDENEIREWAERHDGRPEVIDDPTAGADTVGIRINFPGAADDAPLPDRPVTQETGWSEFFRLFEERGLIFEYDENDDVEDKSQLYRFRPRLQP